ncbi:MAG: 30S ribosomal protein S19e [Candidatus Micrarchaeia archaeon]
MVTPYDVPAKRLIEETARRLEGIGEIKAPQWLSFVKSGAHRERAPEQKNFWYIRCASMLRKMYVNGAMGVGDFRKAYGGRVKHGSRSERHGKAGGKIIRMGLQQLEKIGFVKKTKNGRMLTEKGISFLNEVSAAIKNVAK